MTIFKQLGAHLVFIAILLVPAAAMAQISNSVGLVNTKAVEGKHLWVVSPGTRLVAGDRSRSEFYILGKHEGPIEAPVVKSIEKSIRVKLASNVAPSKMKPILVVNKHHLAKKKIHSKIKMALQHGHGKLNRKPIKG